MYWHDFVTLFEFDAKKAESIADRPVVLRGGTVDACLVLLYRAQGSISIAI